MWNYRQRFVEMEKVLNENVAKNRKIQIQLDGRQIYLIKQLDS